MKMTKSLMAWCAVATAMAVTSAEVSAHGFAVPTGPARSGTGVTTSGNSVGGTTAPANPGGAAPANGGGLGGNTPGSGGGGAGPGAGRNGNGRNNGGPAAGGSTGGRGGRASGLPFGLGRRRRADADKAANVDAAGRKATPGDLPVEPAARGKKFQELLRNDAAKDSDVAYVIETSTTDARMRNVDLRIRVSERRRTAGDIRRRVEVEAKNGEVWETVEVNLLRRVAGQLEAVRWTPAGGTSRVKNAADVSVAGTSVKLADLAPFEVSGSLRYLSAADVDGAVNETYRVVTGSSLDEGSVTFRMDLRAPVRSELRRGGELRRSYDWSGWRFVSGMPVPSRMTVTGGAGETATLEYREAAAVPAFDASLFDAAQLGAK